MRMRMRVRVSFRVRVKVTAKALTFEVSQEDGHTPTTTLGHRSVFLSSYKTR